MLEARGAEVIDADRIGHQVLGPSGSAREAVLVRFGPDVLGPDGGIDRTKLGAIVFADAAARRDLEAISHPAIYAEIRRRLERADPDGPVVVIDAPLLVETGRGRSVGMVALVVVAATPEQQLERAVARGTPKERALAVIGAQATLSHKMAAADYVIDNRGPLDHLGAGVETLWADLQARFGAVPKDSAGPAGHRPALAEVVGDQQQHPDPQQHGDRQDCDS